jgi:hypothetical protein
MPEACRKPSYGRRSMGLACRQTWCKWVSFLTKPLENKHDLGLNGAFSFSRTPHSPGFPILRLISRVCFQNSVVSRSKRSAKAIGKRVLTSPSSGISLAAVQDAGGHITPIAAENATFRVRGPKAAPAHAGKFAAEAVGSATAFTRLDRAATGY